MKIISMTLIAAVFAFALAFVVAPRAAKAQNGWLPPGSYQKSCKNMNAYIYSYSDGKKTPELTAICNEKGISFGKGDPFPSSLDDFHLCDGDIWNDDSTLKCNKNPNSKLMQTAKSAVKNGWQKATGGQPSDAQVSDTLTQMIQNGYLPQFFGGLKPNNVENFINGKVTDLNNAEWRSKIIKQAFYDAWGYKNPPALAMAKWDAKIKDAAPKGSFNISKLLEQAANYKTPYETVLNGETAEINKDLISKKLVALNAYKAAIGRAPSQNEAQFWATGKTGINFRYIVNSLRGTMHQSIGAKLLVEMYKNVLECKGITATDAEVEKLIVKHSADKFIYDDLCK